MSRVAIIHKLLNNINPKHLFLFIERIARKSKYEAGDTIAAMTSLLTIWIKEGVISASELVSMLVDPKNPDKRLASNILRGVHIGRIKSYLLFIYKGLPRPSTRLSY